MNKPNEMPNNMPTMDGRKPMGSPANAQKLTRAEKIAKKHEDMQPL